jgi:hypothetical protein
MTKRATTEVAQWELQNAGIRPIRVYPKLVETLGGGNAEGGAWLCAFSKLQWNVAMHGTSATITHNVERR